MEKKVKVQIQTFFTRDNLFEDMVTKQRPAHYRHFQEVFPYGLVGPIRTSMQDHSLGMNLIRNIEETLDED